MKKKIKYLFLIWILLISIPIGSYFIRENTKIKPGLKYLDDNLTIEDYNVTLNVTANNVISVREEITVNAKKTSDGLYKVIPKWEEYSDGTRRVYVDEVHVNGEAFNFTEDTKSYNIKIGSDKNKLTAGMHTFMIRYDLNLGQDPNKGYDELVYQAFEQYKNKTIKNATITINMPQKFNEKDIQFLIDNNKTKTVTYEVEDNTIIATINNNNKKPVVLSIKLPDNYFKNTTNNYGSCSLIITILMIIVSIILTIKWILNRVNKVKGIEKLEYYPTSNYNVGEYSYLNGETDLKKIVRQLLVSLASKGYLAIEDNKIINLTKTIESKRARIIEVTKLKNSNIDNTPKQRAYLDRLMFNGITYVKRDFDKFYKIATPLKEQGYIDINDRVVEITPELKSNIVKTQINYHNLTDLEAILHQELFKESEVLELDDELLTKLSTVIAEPLHKTVTKKVHSEKTTKLVLATIISSIILMVLWAITYLVVYDMNPKLNLLYYISFGLLFAASLAGIIIERITLYGEKTTAKVEAFKAYLETAEVGTLDQEIEKNKNYFYSIFPYAYALGMKDKWYEAVTKSTKTNPENYDILKDIEI